MHIDWNESEIDAISKAIRIHDQPESKDFRRFARVALNTLHGDSVVEIVARAMEESANPGLNPDRPIQGSHYLRGKPHWHMWIEYAGPAIAEIINLARKQIADAKI